MKEIEEQQLLKNWLISQGIFFYAVINESLWSGIIRKLPIEKKQKDSIIFGINATLKKLGLRAGVSDLVVMTEKHALYIEMKTLKGKQSEVQKTFEKNITKFSYNKYFVAHGHMEAIDFVREEIR